MIKRLLCISFLLNSFQFFAQNLAVIKAKKIDSTDYRFEASIEKYKTSENWTIWSMPFDSVTASSELATIGKNNYYVDQLGDLNLETAWIEGIEGNGTGEKITVTFVFPEDHTKYSTAYQFFGQINIFNGYCKSLKHWQENGRIKTLKVFYNTTEICLIELVDTWHLQEVSIASYFKNNYFQQYLRASHEIVKGDQLTFEIMDVYPGTKYDHIALSEFLIEGAKN